MINGDVFNFPLVLPLLLIKAYLLFGVSHLKKATNKKTPEVMEHIAVFQSNALAKAAVMKRIF